VNKRELVEQVAGRAGLSSGQPSGLQHVLGRPQPVPRRLQPGRAQRR